MTSPYDAAGWALRTKAQRSAQKVYDPESSFWAGAHSGMVMALQVWPVLVMAPMAVIYGGPFSLSVIYMLYTLFLAALLTVVLRVALGVIGAMVALGCTRLWRAVGLDDEMLYVAGLVGGGSVTILALPLAVGISADDGILKVLLYFLPVAASCQLGAVLGAAWSNGFREKSLRDDLTNLSFPIGHLFFASAAVSVALAAIKGLGLPVGWVYGLLGMMLGGQLCSLAAILLLRSVAVRLGRY